MKKDKAPVFVEHENINEFACKMKYGYCIHWPYNMIAAMFSKSETEVKNYINIDDLLAVLNFALNQLKDREREILLYRFMGGNTYASIGQIYALTGERIRQITIQTLFRLRYRNSNLIRNGINWENMYLELHYKDTVLRHYKHKGKRKNRLVKLLLQPETLLVTNCMEMIFPYSPTSSVRLKKELLDIGISNLGELKKAYLDGSLKDMPSYRQLIRVLSLDDFNL